MEVERPDGKKEIILPKPTNMAEFQKEQDFKKPKKKKEWPQPTHGGRDKMTREAHLDEAGNKFHVKPRSITRTRQEEINEERRKARRDKKEYQERKMAA